MGQGQKKKRWMAGALGIFISSAVAMSAVRTFADEVYPVNKPQKYPKVLAPDELVLDVDAASAIGTVDRRIFGSNLEWFNNAGGLAADSAALRERLVTLARDQGTTVYRFPGGILADYYRWLDGTGPRITRPVTRHPTDNGSSAHRFGTPEFFEFLRRTGADGLITVNAGTGTAAEAAAWVAYTNQPKNAKRAKDGFAEPAGITLWEIGNELYLPGNPTEKKITVTAEVYADRFVLFADAMRAVDPSIKVIAIGVAKSHIGPDSEFPDWTEKLLARAADKIDMIAVHNAYFPLLYKVKQPRVDEVYPALWAAPEAVDESLTNLEALISRYEGKRKIGIAITEWGTLFSVPRADPYWVDHVKTLGSGVYVGRMLQVLISHPRMQLANYFKFADRSFMGWVDLNGNPKVPYWVFKLYAQYTGDLRVQTHMTPPMSYNAKQIGVMKAQTKVPEVTAVATRDSKSGRLYVNLVNRSLGRIYNVRVALKNFSPEEGELLMVTADEPTAHNGRDIPPEWPYRAEFDPFTSAPPNSVRINSYIWQKGEPVRIPPFSVATLVLKGTSRPSPSP